MRSFLPAPALAGAVGVAVVASLFLFPSVRGSAQAMLDLFRVRKFAAVPFDQTRLERLRSLQNNSTLMVFDQHEMLVDPGPPRRFATLEEGAVAAGIDARRPGFLPNGMVERGCSACAKDFGPIQAMDRPQESIRGAMRRARSRESPSRS